MVREPGLDDEVSEGVDSSSRAVRTVAHRRRALVVPVLPPRAPGVAPIAKVKARLSAARAAKDGVEAAVSSHELLELLLEQGTQLDEVIALGEASLAVEDDPGLRYRLGELLETLGESSRAARIFADLATAAPPEEASQFFVRAGVAYARAGDSASAREALLLATGLDERDALAFELLGVVAAVTEEELAGVVADERVASRSSAAYFAAARRRAAEGDAQGELEDLLRAFDVDPGSARAEEALVMALVARGRVGAAEEVRRRHANSASARRVVHARRASAAVARGELPRALGAALEAELDVDPMAEHGSTFDGWLLRAGLLEVLAARLALRARVADAAEAATSWMELGRLLEGSLASPDRAIHAYVNAVSADPANGESLRVLDALATREGKRAWVLEALVRGMLRKCVHDARSDSPVDTNAARSLASIAMREGDEVLSGAAWEAVARIEPADEHARESAARASEALGRHRERGKGALREAEETGDPEARRAKLEEAARWLGPLPDASGELAQTFEALAAEHPADTAKFEDAIRLSERLGDSSRTARVCRARLAVVADDARARTELAWALARLGEWGEAAAVVEGGSAVSPETIAMAWVLGARAGAREVRARAMASASEMAGPGMAATLSVVASEELLAAGDGTRARSLAEAAHRADPDSAQVLLALAACVPDEEAKLVATLLSRVVTSSIPSSALCARLAEAHQRLGDPEMSLAWTRRWVALRPADEVALVRLVDRAILGADRETWAEVLSWLIPQPQPASTLAPLVARALVGFARLDPVAAAAMARRAIDTLGPQNTELREAVERVAREAQDSALGIALDERCLARLDPRERGPRLLALAARHRAVGDPAREADALLRAVDAGIDLGRTELPALDPRAATDSKDGEISLLAVALAVARNQGPADEAMARARELGAALWTWASDPAGALDVWVSAARAYGALGPRVLRVDLTTFAGAREAERHLAALGQREVDPGYAGRLSIEAARAALECGAFPRALTHARNAITTRPTLAEALEVAEVAAVRAGRPRELQALYDLVADGARGRFGRRAAHHRAARFFEAEGLPMFALKHAAQAFMAVPAEGTTLALLEKTARKANRPGIAARTVEHIADLARTEEERATWLVRAIDLTGDDSDGLHQRFDLLLKAAALRAAPGLGQRLAKTARAIAAKSSGEREALAVRLEQASDDLTRRIEGPDGARICIAFAEIALDPFEHVGWAWQSLHRAFDADADVDEFAGLIESSARLAGHPAAHTGLERWFAAAAKPYANVGPAVFRLMAAIARELGDAQLVARALVSAVERDADDEELVADAEEAVAAVGSEELAARLAKKVGPRDRRPAPDTGPTSGHHVVDSAPESSATGAEPGSLSELRAAAMAHPTFDAWLRVERAADVVEDASGCVEALHNLVGLATPDVLTDVLKRLARAEGARGNLVEAERQWGEVVARVPADVDADVALEAIYVARGSFLALAEHLGRRIERLSGADDASATRRALRLRRAAIFEQRLLQREDAAAELERLLIEFPGNESALHWLADLNERLGWHKDTLRVLDELSRRPMEPQERELLQIRRARAMLALGDGDGARSTVVQLVRHPLDAVAVSELRVEVGRELDDAEDLGAALVELARSSPKDALTRADLFVEAAQVAARLGHDRVALERAAEGAALVPHSASVQLFARGLEYRVRGAGTREEAERTIDVLSKIQAEGAVADEDVPLAAYLLAEAEDVVAPGSGERTLRACLARTGAHPLLALGLADRAVAAGRVGEALVGYAEALSGNLLGLKSEGAVALAAAAMADPATDREFVSRLLDRAEGDPATADAARARRATLAPSAEASLSEGRGAGAPVSPGFVADDAGRGSNDLAESGTDRVTPTMGSRPVDVESVETPLAFTPAGELREAYASLYRGDSAAAEQLLFEALRGGSLEAADALDALLAKDRTRGSELLAVRRRAAELEAGNLKRLARVREAARLDQNPHLFRAVDHVMAPFEAGRDAVLAPPLSAQNVQPGMLTLLRRHSLEPLGEALAIVWEHAHGLFVDPLASAKATGVDRVLPGAASPLSRLYEVAVRLLDAPAVSVFHRRANEPDRMSVMLSWPPGAVLTGEARDDTPSLRWHLGQALSSALPENVLLYGLDEAGGRALLEVLGVAFGSSAHALDRSQAQLAESLWQAVPARAQRRLRDLLSTEVPYELAMERAKQSGRRMGLFLTGDFSFAARRVLDEFPEVAGRTPDGQGGLADLCEKLPALADLFRLAIMPEYADARWRRPATRGAFPSGTMRAV